MSNKKEIESLKSVNIIGLGVNRRLLMSASRVMVFEVFLKENIGEEVLVVNTNIGMEIYYYSKNDYSLFIKESILLYVLTKRNCEKLKFTNNLNRVEVYKSFCEALFTFSKYPQTFLAYTKKFIYLKEKNESSKFVIPILNSFFEEALKVIEKTGKMPHYKKIHDAKNKSQKSDSDKILIKSLISEILLKRHSN
ncbi:hypothetical protein ACSTS3_15265 [Aquimarina muelleri]|uniref:hypothetical protein n=1 Tax=Aquimarina muelleri TaxID=279356 RepID=UPI003F683629